MQNLDSQKKYRLLFVCLGNICRSPAAEGIMKQKIEDQGLTDRVEVDSAGTSGYHIGDLPDLRMRKHGAKRGYEFDSKARRFTEQDFDQFDMILAMDDSNYHNIMQMAPDLISEDKVYRMVHFSKKYTHDHIPDPYYSGADGFELVLDLLEDACEGLVDELKEKTK